MPVARRVPKSTVLFGAALVAGSLGLTSCGVEDTSAAKATLATIPTVHEVSSCPFRSLTVSLGREGAGLGHVGQTIEFRNTGGVTCSIAGYPTIAGLNEADGHVVKAVPTPSGYLGGELSGASDYTTVTLPPGAVAAAMVEGTDVAMNPREVHCSALRVLDVTPPDTQRSVRLAAELPACTQIQVHPVIAGPLGRVN